MKDKELIKIVEAKVPSIRKNIKRCKKIDARFLFHQDTFAADFQESEFLLLGMVIKYVGIYGIEIIIVGKNRETLKK